MDQTTKVIGSSWMGYHIPAKFSSSPGRFLDFGVIFWMNIVVVFLFFHWIFISHDSSWPLHLYLISVFAFDNSCFSEMRVFEIRLIIVSIIYSSRILLCFCHSVFLKQSLRTSIEHSTRTSKPHLLFALRLHVSGRALFVLAFMQYLLCL